MFKKQQKLTPPAVLTADQIFEDLATFKPPATETPERSERVRSLPSNAEVASWWKIFETFIADVEDFRELKSHMEDLRKSLESCHADLNDKATDIRQQVDEVLTQLHEATTVSNVKDDTQPADTEVEQ